MRNRMRRAGIRNTLFTVCAVLAVTLPSAVSAKDALTLRVNDAFAEPGGLAAIVIRTYATKPISQGQVCFRARPLGGATQTPAGMSAGVAVAANSDIFESLVGVKVFAKRKDALAAVSFDEASGERVVMIEFSSDSGSINKVDGPLAVIYYRLRDNVSPGEEYRIEIDAANTLVFDGNGAPIKFAPRAGRLRIRSPSGPYEAEAEGDKIRPGERAELGLETFEPVAMASGQIGIHFDPEIASGKPKVKLGRKHGKRRASIDRSTPGLVFVTFRSPNNSWNMVPGEILSIGLPTSRRVKLGTRSKITIDPSLTFFVDPEGDILPYTFEDGSVRFQSKGSGGGGGGSDD